MYSIVYITCSNKEEAKNISKALLADRLIACANIHSIDSLYHWEEKIAEDSESVLWCKTKEEKIPEIESLVKKLHSYKVPCIANFPFKANAEYLQWIEEQLIST
jgi:periplasmic divalent cation tolerance protein